jgi:hypothetical protein
MNGFERNRPAALIFFGGLFAMGVNFGYVVLAGGSPIKESTYGAAVYTFPALWWCGIQVGGALAAIAGYTFRVRWLAVIGSLICAAEFAAFGALAAKASDGILLNTASLYVAVPFSCFAAWHAAWGGHGR